MERKIETVVTPEFTSKVLRANTDEKRQEAFEICFVVNSWKIFKFLDGQSIGKVWALATHAQGGHNHLVEWRNEQQAKEVKRD
jgi:hypothetical protein